jgi:hypothetical protein
MMRNIPEDRRSQQHRGGSLKSRIQVSAYNEAVIRLTVKILECPGYAPFVKDVTNDQSYYYYYYYYYY